VGGDVCLRVVVVYAGLLGVWEGEGVREKVLQQNFITIFLEFCYQTILAKGL
jgi:hypothetical protein